MVCIGLQLMQLVDEVEHEIMHYQNQGLSYLPKLKITHADIRSQNIIFPSKVTVSERILVGRQPFFHRYGEKEIFCFFSRESYSRPQYQTRS